MVDVKNDIYPTAGCRQLFPRRLVEFFQKDRHFLFRLLVAVSLRGDQPLLPGGARSGRIIGGLQRLAEQFPGGGIFRIQFNAAAQMLGSARRFPRVQITLAQPKAQQGIVDTLGKHVFQRRKHVSLLWRGSAEAYLTVFSAEMTVTPSRTHKPWAG